MTSRRTRAPRWIARHACIPALLLACGCANNETQRADLPATLHGAYARGPDDVFFDTLGLEVDLDTLRFAELRLRILGAKMVGNDTVQVTDAELTWARSSGAPKHCKGTIARQGDHLLLDLYDKTSDRHCDPLLDANWRALRLVKEFPEPLRGTFGRASPYAVGKGVRIDAPEALLPGKERPFVLERAVVFESDPETLLVRDGRIGDAQCKGTITLEGDTLTGSMRPLDGDESANDAQQCPQFGGTRWTIDHNALPNHPLTNGKVRVEIRGETALITTTDDQGLRCEQTVQRTTEISVQQSVRRGIPVAGGTLVTLGLAQLKAGGQACRERLQGLAAAECEEYLGAACDSETLAAADDAPETLTCPTHLVLGDPTPEGRKVAFLPDALPFAICWETRERFQAE